MENRKPARGPSGKYGKSPRNDSGSSPRSGRPLKRYTKTDENETKGYRPAGKSSGRLDVSGQNATDRRKSVEKPSARYERTGGVESGRRTSGKNLTRKNVSVIKGNKKDPALIRLNRFIANSGVCSRRDADEHIRNGLVTVNGSLVTDLGTKVSYNDDIRFKNRKLSAEKKVYILMNKPKDYVTTVEDPHAEHTVLDLIGDDCPERVYPVGRLDKATTGVLLLTNDGDLAGKLTHPKYKRKKIYHVFLDIPVTKNDLFKITEGIELDGVTVIADAVSYADPDDKSQIGIELHSGQNRVIRRMFETLGYKVKKLDRVYFAGLTKKNVQRGKWRFLTDKEVSMLKRGIF
jgi:23S rRNA pseudouridine2605 synthase